MNANKSISPYPLMLTIMICMTNQDKPTARRPLSRAAWGCCR